MTEKTSNNESSKEYGVISIENGFLNWKFSKENEINFDLSEIAIIGEWTNDLGPFQTDWFLVLVNRNGRWLEIPMYAIIQSNQLNKLSEYFKHEIKPKLVISTDLESIVIWPKKNSNQKLFTFIYKNKKGVLSKLKSIFFGNSYHLKLSTELSHLITG